MDMKASTELDALIIGAGFTGLYQLWMLRKLGLNARIVDAAPEVGGTWYWNCYPGARTDSPSHVYQYWFSKDLLDDWDWSQKYSDHRETQSYLNHVADRFELRSDIDFETRVSEASWNESSELWSVSCDNGRRYQTRFVICAMGPLSEPQVPPFAGHDQFQGPLVHTARWPREGIDLKGKRVAVIGTGATGIQVIQTIADEVEQLTVFQRTANYAVPMKNPKYGPQDMAAVRAQYPQTEKTIWNTFVGFDADLDPREFWSVAPEDRRKTLETLWEDGTLKIWLAGFREILTDEAASKEVSDFVREKIRARIQDPEMARKLLPDDHGFGTRRVPLENGYFEVFNRDNVDLVSLKETPIECFTQQGVKTTEAEYAVDVIILATGFDAGTGGFTAIDIRGREGISLRDQWKQDVRTTMGLQIHGYPNLFTTSAPYAPAAAFCNAPTCLQHQVKWISACIEFMQKHGHRVIEPGAETESQWIAHHQEIADTTLVAKTKSWYTGYNIEGKKKGLLSYIGGFPAYRQACDEVADKGYAGFEFS